MFTDDLAREAAELFILDDPSGARSLHRLVELVARRVPACSGATATLWQAGEAIATAATHPDLAALADVQHETGIGPLVDAARTGEQVGCPDTLNETRWPEFAAAALGRGVRCTATLVHQFDSMVVTLTLYSVRPQALDPQRLPLASLLTAFGGAALANASLYDNAQRTATQLREAVESRTIVDQAKGMLMHALGCSEQDAFDRLRRVSQTQHVKLVDVARQVIESRARQTPE